jgi:hypothetical protein
MTKLQPNYCFMASKTQATAKVVYKENHHQVQLLAFINSPQRAQSTNPTWLPRCSHPGSLYPGYTYTSRFPTSGFPNYLVQCIQSTNNLPPTTYKKSIHHLVCSAIRCAPVQCIVQCYSQCSVSHRTALPVTSRAIYNQPTINHQLLFSFF